MTAAELLRDLQDQKIGLEVNGPNLIVDAPKGKLTEALKKRIASMKPELVSLLSVEITESAIVKLVPKEATPSWDETNGMVSHLKHKFKLVAVPYACVCCSSEVFWRRNDLENWVCPYCHPPVHESVVYGCRIRFEWRN